MLIRVKNAFVNELHQQTSPKLLIIWWTHGSNIVYNVVKINKIVNSIVTILFAISSISTILLSYMVTISLRNIVKIANIVTIL